MTGELAIEQFCRLLYRARKADRLDILMLADALEESGMDWGTLWLRRVPHEVRAYEVLDHPEWTCARTLDVEEREVFPVHGAWVEYHMGNRDLRNTMHRILKRMEDSYGEG